MHIHNNIWLLLTLACLASCVKETIYRPDPEDTPGDATLGHMCAATDTVRQLLIVAGASYDEYIRSNNHRLEDNSKADFLYFETTEPLEGKGSSIHTLLQS